MVKEDNISERVYTIREGDTLVLQCLVTGHPRPQVGPILPARPLLPPTPTLGSQLEKPKQGLGTRGDSGKYTEDRRWGWGSSWKMNSLGAGLEAAGLFAWKHRWPRRNTECRVFGSTPSLMSVSRHILRCSFRPG